MNISIYRSPFYLIIHMHMSYKLLNIVFCTLQIQLMYNLSSDVAVTEWSYFTFLSFFSFFCQPFVVPALICSSLDQARRARAAEWSRVAELNVKTATRTDATTTTTKGRRASEAADLKMSSLFSRDAASLTTENEWCLASSALYLSPLTPWSGIWPCVSGWSGMIASTHGLWITAVTCSTESQVYAVYTV